MSTETTNKKIKIDNGTTFGKTYTDKAIDERLQGLVSTATFTPVKEKANNSLQKPAGLTKTKLVGVGTNGQENIEIGDNLTLANGKLSATGGSSEVNIIEGTVTSVTGDIMHFTVNKDIDLNKVNILFIDGSYMVFNRTYTNINGNSGYFNYIGHEGALVTGTVSGRNGNATVSYSWIPQYFYHFITLTNSTSTFYFTYQNISEDKLNTLDSLKTALSGKSLLCTGHTDSDTAEYISGEGGNIVVGVVNKSDNSTSGITIDSSFTITDLVSPVE